MYCLKCGQETGSEKIFCDQCLDSMDQYPVKPGTAIHLPRRDAVQTPKKSSRSKRNTSLEEQIVYLKKVIRWMGCLLIFSVVVLACAMLLLTFL